MTDGNVTNGNQPDQLQTLRTETRMMSSRTLVEDSSPRKSGRSYGSKRSTLEEELRSLSTTPRMSHEDFGRVVSPPSPEDQMYDKALASLQATSQSGSTQAHIQQTYQSGSTQALIKQTSQSGSTRALIQQTSQSHSGSTQTLLQLELKEAKAIERDLEKRLREIDEERKDLNVKLAALRVKLGVANANYNVSKTECDQLRKKYQETQIKEARLEERINNNSKELARLTDPNNPESNVNIKKAVLSDRKEIKALRASLEGTRAERSELQKQIDQRNDKIRELTAAIKGVKKQLGTCQKDFSVAKESAQAERDKREEVEVMYQELYEEKEEFDKKMDQLHAQRRTANAETSEIKKQIEQFVDTEQTLVEKIEKADRQLRDTLTFMEQEKNADMPVRTASSIKYHQYRMARNGAVTDTTPRVIVTTNPHASIAASGMMGKTVVSLKPATSTSSLPGSKPAPSRAKPSSLPAKR